MLFSERLAKPGATVPGVYNYHCGLVCNYVTFFIVEIADKDTTHQLNNTHSFKSYMYCTEV